MAKLPLILVLAAMILLLFIQASLSKKQTHIWVLNVRASTHSISVYPDGRVLSSPTPASLYSLFRVQVLSKSRLQSTVTIEGLATGRFICMNDKGRLITKKREKSERSTGTKKKRSPPDPQHCTFKVHTFRGFGNPAYGFYLDVPRSNGTRGRFVAFNKYGQPRKMVKKLQSLRMSQALAIKYNQKYQMNDLIRATTFERLPGINGTRRFNRGVRKCLRLADLGGSAMYRPGAFGKKMQECVQSEVYNACVRRAKRKNGSARRQMPQDSKQRHPRDLRISSTSSNSMEVLEPCRQLAASYKEEMD